MARSSATDKDRPDTIVRRTIDSLRKDLLSLLCGESTPQLLTTFLSACSKFDSYVSSYHEELTDETMEALLEFSTPLATLSSNMIELNNNKEEALVHASADIAALLSDKTSHLSLETEKDASPYPSYLEPCARWLKENCHNPYPSAEVRSEICRQTKSERKDVDAWFIDARRRIGWNDLRRKYFNNKRAKILQAAAIFFNIELIPSDSDALEPHIEGEFAAVFGRARALYEEKFSQSKLADRLDSAVRDMAPSLKGHWKSEKTRGTVESKKSRANYTCARHAYPTPERSPTTPAELLASPPSPVINLAAVDVSPSISRKRRRSFQLEGEDAASPLCKRPRSETIHRQSTSDKGLPSPSASTQEDLSESPAASPPRQVSAPPLNPTDASRTTGKRKRRLSDGFQYPAAKRPQKRTQAVSDPLPATNVEDWDQWFRDHVLSSPELTLTGEVPPPVTVEAPDSNTPLDIQLFNFPLIPDLPPSAPAVPAPVAELNIVESLEVPKATQDNVDPAATALDPTFSWVPNDFSPPLQPTNTFSSSTDLYVNSTMFHTMGVITQPFPNTNSSSFFPDPSLWSNLPVPELDFSALFHQPSTTSTMASSIQLPSQSTFSTSRALSEQEREAKRKELEELEARAQAIRAEICAP
uniref:Mating-type protein beta 1 n=1 Tax=Coprinopsis cinerea TaxID=5346 RepID=Q9Y7A3_COPCI|nr:mating-type protein beta 1 [Coprinopsis cinerea]